MEKCNCWEEKEIIMGYYLDQPVKKVKQICNGTKEREACNCNGDVKKCNFYPDKRKESESMNTAEMWLKAQQDGKTYYCGPLEYQKDFGLRYRETKGTPYQGAWVSLNHFMKERWCSYPVMTKSEAEAKFNIKIVGD